MPIPESQLNTWASQGSIAGSSNTYNSIKNILESSDAPYAHKAFTVYLQGSYGNDTNIYAESDVDIVIQLTSCYYFGLANLTPEQQATYQRDRVGATYDLPQFKQDVLKHLRAKYGVLNVIPGDKAIRIAANGNRRKADVIVSANYREYYRYTTKSDERHQKGMCFHNASSKLIANYPKIHSANCTIKHQGSMEWYKPTVRIFKNMRNRLIAEDMIAQGDAPSYFIEGMLYNVPNHSFCVSYEDTVINSLNWLADADRAALLCANEQYYLLREESPVTWREEKYDEFINAACDLWRQW